MDIKNLQSFYQDQNIRIRKQIRQMDIQLKEVIQNSKSSSQKSQVHLQNINFLVIGPSKSGKSSLLKTLHFALNSNFNPQITTTELPGVTINRYDIKKNKKYQIQGLAKLKQTDPKKSITGFEFQDKTSSDHSKIFQKYSNALQLIDNKIFGCFKISLSQQIFHDQQNHQLNPAVVGIRAVLIVLHVTEKIQFSEMSCLKCFLAQIQQKGIKILIALTHIDRLNNLKQNDKLKLIEQRISLLAKQLDIKNRDDFICVQNYHQSGKLFRRTPIRQSNFSGNAKNKDKRCYKFSTKIYPHGPILFQQGSEQYLKNQNLEIQVPITSNYQKSYLLNRQFSTHTSIQPNSSQENQSIKIFAKSVSSINDCKPPQKQNKCNFKKVIEEQQSVLKNCYQKIQQFQSKSLKNSEQINYYSLKLLMKIIRECEKCIIQELKHKKAIKWFCG